jgi:hypothetical protein
MGSSLLTFIKKFMIPSVIATTSCVTAHVDERDKLLHQKIVGPWSVAFDDTDPPSESYYYSDGRVTYDWKNENLHCAGLWRVDQGMLYVDVKDKTPSCPYAPSKTVDIIEFVDDHDLILKAEDGMTLHRVRPLETNAADQNPNLNPKFAWPETGSVRVRERLFKYDKQTGRSYILTWKEKGDKIQFSMKDFKFHAFNGRNVEGDQGKQLRQIESTVSETLPQFLVTRQGRYIGLENLDTALRKASDLMSYEEVTTDPRFRSAVEDDNHMLWLRMAGLWAVLPIEAGKPVWHASSATWLPKSFPMANAMVSFLGRCQRAKNCVRLLLETKKTGPEADPLLQIALERKLGLSAHEVQLTVDESVLVDIDYDTLKPFEISKRKVATVKKADKSMEIVEEHGIFFDWSQALGKAE